MLAKAIHVVPHPNGWATRFDGAATVTQTFDHKRDALGWALGYAEASNAAVVVHGASPILRLSRFLETKLS
jgi:Uncharacterized protein conserved in bacteria (DUF2188)